MAERTAGRVAFSSSHGTVVSGSKSAGLMLLACARNGAAQKKNTAGIIFI
jgi:hypothetical protein